MGFDGFWFWPFAAAFAGAWIVIGILFLAFWIWMIIDCAKRKFRNDVEKIVWIIVIVFGIWMMIGAIAYFLVVKMTNPKGLVKK